MKIEEISQAAFNAFDISRKIVVHDYARRYAAVEVGTYWFGLCWRSDRIEPVIQSSPDGATVWMGVDQQLAAVEVKNGRVFLHVELDTSLLQIAMRGRFVIALTETEALIFDWKGSVLVRKGLPELPDSVDYENEVLIIRLLDGQTIEISAQKSL